jgi:hypothetical protein
MEYYTFICPVLFCEAVCLYSVFESTIMSNDIIIIIITITITITNTYW